MKTIHEDLKRSISTSQIITHFKKRGVELSKSDAERYLNLLYFLAKQVVKQNFISSQNGTSGESEKLEPYIKLKNQNKQL
ncbi:hypothetical protein [Mucilaginibacter dorajii]|uniref:Uncharacterized protein n=1 Tax=Mucilaginibacter dorajii TaxID=692994 RepID=A0ABP7PBZ7_9SPHI|nr:hypothetical protein [Mucilaginibacter dorajii]MCS3734794.1 hypothetical protein [Mucilaginibacter dorajii]